MDQIRAWIRSRPGIFALREEGRSFIIQEHYSQKELSFGPGDVASAQLETNRLKPEEDYLLLTLDSGAPLALSPQGFAFAPNFGSTGPLPLPSQVYCLQDFQSLLHKLENLTVQGEQRRDALDLLMVLIAILDGAKAVGLNVTAEEKQVEAQLVRLESSQ